MASHNILITGANRGIGLELTKQFLKSTKKHLKVFATYRNKDTAQELCDLQKAYSDKLEIFQFDVEKHETFPAFEEKIAASLKGQGLNVLLNNAGINEKAGNPQALEKPELSATLLQRHFAVNAVSPLLLVKVFLPLLRKASENNKDKPAGFDRAAIFNMSTQMTSSTLNTGNFYAYRASKGALNVITTTLSKDLEKDQILAIALHPGHVRTDMGGANAKLSPEDSVAGLIDVMENADNSKNGKLLSYDGRIIPF